MFIIINYVQGNPIIARNCGHWCITRLKLWLKNSDFTVRIDIQFITRLFYLLFQTTTGKWCFPVLISKMFQTLDYGWHRLVGACKIVDIQSMKYIQIMGNIKLPVVHMTSVWYFSTWVSATPVLLHECRTIWCTNHAPDRVPLRQQKIALIMTSLLLLLLWYFIEFDSYGWYSN